MNNIDKFNPFEIIQKIQKQKYTAAIVPFILVLIGFFLNNTFNIIWGKYFSLLGLLGFVFILVVYNTEKKVPDVDKHNIISPVNGKVIAIEKNHITIRKGLFLAADLRLGSIDPEYKIKITKGKSYIYSKSPNHQGVLTGIIPGIGEIQVSFPDKFKIEVDLYENLKAGDSLIARNSDCD